MTDVMVTAQLELLATQLEVDIVQVQQFAHLGIDGLKELRHAISAYLFDSEAEMFGRVSKLAPLVPDALVVTVAHAAVPPLVAGRLAGALGQAHKDRAVSLLKKMRPTYLAEAAQYVDPRAIAIMAPEFDDAPEALLPAAKVMLERKQYAVAASFLEYATPKLIAAFARGLDDIESLIEAVAYVDADEHLSKVIRFVPDDRLREIMIGNLDNEQGVLAALSVGTRIDADLTEKVGNMLLLDATDEQLTMMLETVRKAGVEDQLQTVAARSGTKAQARLAKLA